MAHPKFALVCGTCRQKIDPDKQSETYMRAQMCGVTSKYAVCAECWQEVMPPWKTEYKKRWRKADSERRKL